MQQDTTALSTIILKGSPIKQALQNTAASIAMITTVDINKTDGIILTPVLNKIPGVTMQQGALAQPPGRSAVHGGFQHHADP